MRERVVEERERGCSLFIFFGVDQYLTLYPSLDPNTLEMRLINADVLNACSTNENFINFVGTSLSRQCRD